MDKDYASVATAYAQDVVEGRIPAGRYTRLACERHLRDLERQGTPGFPFVFDPAQVYRYCAFAETMPHVKGRWARGQRLKLQPWQVFIEGSISGWVHRDTGLRRFRLAYVEIPRKNGKSMMAAARGLYMLTEDDEPGAEVFCGAATEEQAGKVYDPAKAMARKNHAFREHYGVVVHEQAIFVPETGSKMETMIGNPGDGDSPSCAIIDEYHEHPTSGQFDTMTSGMGAREQPLAYVITTSGYSLVSPCYALRAEITGILEGTFQDETYFGIVYHADVEDDWESDEAYIKANPNLGVSVSEEYLRSQRDKGKRSTRGRRVYLTKHLDRWIQAGEPYFDFDAWLRAQVFRLDDLEGAACWMGLDLASHKDLAALSLLFKQDGVLRHASRFWLPQSQVDAVQAVPYAEWVDKGFIRATPGDTIDYEMIESEILEICTRFDVQEIGYDSFQATYLVTNLQKKGLNLVTVGQGYKTMSEPMKVFDQLMMEGRIEHDGNECMSWNVANTQAKFSQGSDHIRPVKARDEEKIDGVVAALMAMNRLIASEVEPEKETPWWEREGETFEV